MDKDKAVVIIGGGLAGLTAAIHLRKIGLSVTLIERNEYPKHKVCGEYISNEIVPYMNWLSLDFAELHPTSISKLHFSTVSGRSIYCDLPLGGFGVSRYALDFYLYKKAIEKGCEIITDTVEDVNFDKDTFTIVTSGDKLLKSEIVIGAFGKRSNIDVKLNRDFIQKKSHWLAVKAHYSTEFADNLVGLHNFEGGYCGVSKVEDNRVNICYLANYKTFKNYKNIQDYQTKVVAKNPYLNLIFKDAQLLFDKPLTISQISFDRKATIQNHILMIGDTAGLIHPLCGNGMAMAIHSAQIVSQLVGKFYSEEIKSRNDLEKKYIQQWNFNFKKRLKAGRFLAFILQKPKTATVLLKILSKFPSVIQTIIKYTHGKPIVIEQSN